MKNIAGKICGFIFGVAGFLIAFKFIVLDNTPPSDELAPGIVVFIAILNGFLFAFIGSQLHNYLRKRTT